MGELNVEQACRVVADGGVIAYPTEAVYGLGCDPANADAVARVIALKGRDAAKGLILIAAGEEQLDGWLKPGAAEELARARASWPGPVTWVMSAAPGIGPPVAREEGTVAVRVTDHDVSRALCRACGGPLVSTSANPAGQPPARTAQEVAAYFGAAVDATVAGACGGRRRPSEIRDARTGAVLRPG